MSLFKQIEEKALDHILGISLGLPASLLASTWFLLSFFLPAGVENSKAIKGLLSLIASLSGAVLVLAAFLILLIHRQKEKPDFGGFVHDPDNAYWVNKATGQKICEACKAKGELTLLSRCGDGWKCPIHPTVVGCPKSYGPIIRDDCVNTAD